MVSDRNQNMPSVLFKHTQLVLFQQSLSFWICLNICQTKLFCHKLQQFNWFAINIVGLLPILLLLCARLSDNDDWAWLPGDIWKPHEFHIENAEKLFLRHLHHSSGGRQAVRGGFLLIIDQTDDEAGNMKPNLYLRGVVKSKQTFCALK